MAAEIPAHVYGPPNIAPGVQYVVPVDELDTIAPENYWIEDGDAHPEYLEDCNGTWSGADFHANVTQHNSVWSGNPVGDYAILNDRFAHMDHAQC